MSKVKMNANRTKWGNAVREVLGDVETIGRDDIRTVLDATGMNFPYWQVQASPKAERGVYYGPSLAGQIGGTPVT